jgi:hypothetical protein
MAASGFAVSNIVCVKSSENRLGVKGEKAKRGGGNTKPKSQLPFPHFPF